MKYILPGLMLIHAVIHFCGYAGSVDLLNIAGFNLGISKTGGIFWLLASILLLVNAVFYITRNQYWWMPAISTVILSQLLLSFYWNDAKYGTLVNLVILTAAILGFAEWSFNRRINREISSILVMPATGIMQPVAKDRMKSLPPVVQRWLDHSGIAGKEPVHFVRLKQKGSMISKPGGRQMNFTAEQYYNTDYPAFIWKAKVDIMPLLYMTGRDRFENGEGEMLIRLLSVKNIVNSKPSPSLNHASMQRYLAEICWFPSAALNDYIHWDTIDSLSARATMTYKGLSVSGIFLFNDAADVRAFETLRYREAGKNSSLKKWQISLADHRSFSGIRIPCKCEVTWKLKEGDFNWLKLELTELDYNIPGIYE